MAWHGDFWYPIQLIQYFSDEGIWLVCWWRGCFFEAASADVSIAAGSITRVVESDIIDSLWGDRTHRRRIHVSSTLLLYSTDNTFSII